MIGGEGLKIQIFKIDNALEDWVISQNLDIENGGLGGSIKSIGLNFSREDQLVVVSDKRCIYGGKVKLTEEPQQVTKYKKTKAELEIMEEMNYGVFRLIADPGHSDKVISADLCVRKPYLATCSPDKTLKVWDYVEK
jgi:cilia- and flagella-associated protein 57